MFVTDKTTVIIPSDIKIVVKKITDKDGEEIDVRDIIIKFVFSDGGGNFMQCYSNPFDEKYENCTMGEDGKLHLILSGYRFKPGQLYVKVGVLVSDEEFPDGYWDWWYQPEYSNIYLR